MCCERSSAATDTGESCRLARQVCGNGWCDETAQQSHICAIVAACRKQRSQALSLLP